MDQLINTGQLNGADRQLVVMICLQLILVVISTISYGIYNTYTLITLFGVYFSFKSFHFIG
jgi:hypothetical protein